MTAQPMTRWTIGLRAPLCAALVLAALAAPPALADARAEAKRHFGKGMSLISAGEIERGIAELKQAYAIKQHPDVLYDIARAYVDLGDIPEALAYFRLYVATNPKDKEQVQGMIRRLEAAIGAAPQPGSPGQSKELEKLMAQMRELIEKAQQPGAEAAPAPAKGPEMQAAKPSEDDMFEEQTISPGPAPAPGK
jgi:iron complex outermembrane receptor protein